jgi:nucleoside-diphosphate-sugar epimerase
MAKLLIVGGSGFFGKSILDAFSRGLLKKWNINKIDIVSRNARQLKKLNANLISEGINLYNLDISKCDSLPKADYIIHAAASTDAARYLSRPIEERENILASTKNYCQIARLDHRGCKIIYASSGAIYGQQPSDIELIPETYPIGSIDEMVESKRDYAAAKRDAELEILNLGAQGLDVSIARCFNFIGPYLPLKQHFAFGNFINDGINNQKIVVNAEHQVIRAHQYSDDLACWLMAILEISNPMCPIYNVGSEQSIEVRDLALLVANYFKVDLSMKPISSSKIDRYVPSTEKIRNELGLKLSIDLEEALDRTVRQIKLNKVNG